MSLVIADRSSIIWILVHDIVLDACSQFRPTCARRNIDTKYQEVNSNYNTKNCTHNSETNVDFSRSWILGLKVPKTRLKPHWHHNRVRNVIKMGRTLWSAIFRIRRLLEGSDERIFKRSEPLVSHANYGFIEVIKSRISKKSLRFLLKGT